MLSGKFIFVYPLLSSFNISTIVVQFFCMNNIFFFLFILLSTGLFSQQKYSRVKIFADGNELKELSALGVCIDHGEYKKNIFFISDFSEAEIEIIRTKGFNYEILIDDIQKFYNEQNNPSSDKYVPEPLPATQGCNTSINYPTPANFSLGSVGGFFTYNEIMQHLDNMAMLFPNLIKAKSPLDSLTYEGRPVYWLKISDNPNIDESEPEILYTAIHHAREPASVSQLIMYMYYLLENYNSNAEVKYLVDNVEMYFVPVVNPDGYIYNETNNPGGGGMWRKNRRDNQDGSFGVDLNRNYGYNWAFDNMGSSPNTSSDTYRGMTAFSEPETKNLQNFCSQRQFKIALNYHTYGNLLIYPWGYQPNIYTPDSAQFVEYAKYLTHQNHYNFGTPNQTVGYVVNGSSDDWMYGEQTIKGKIFAMTPEVGDVTNGFWPPQNLIVSICKENIAQNLRAAHLLLKHASVSDNEPRYISSQNGFFNYTLTCLGIDVPATFTVAIIPVSSEITNVGAPKVYSNLGLLQSISDSISFTISASTTQGQLLKYIISVNNGLYSFNDTIVKVFGNPVILFASNGNSMTGWSSPTGWGFDNSFSYSPPASISDSPNGIYQGNDSTYISTSSAINLSGAISATLSFYGRWEIEPRFDYAEVMISTDGGISYSALCGKYTKLGNSYQDPQQPLYDGFMMPWVREEINLDNYVNQNIIIGFMLKSDWGNEYDGFFFDDLKVEAIISSNSTGEDKNNFNFSVFPNPSDGRFYISSAGFKISKAIVTDMLGKEIYEAHNQHQKVIIDLSENPNGFYFLKVFDKQGNFGVKKILIR